MWSLPSDKHFNGPRVPNSSPSRHEKTAQTQQLPMRRGPLFLIFQCLFPFKFVFFSCQVEEQVHVSRQVIRRGYDLHRTDDPDRPD